MILALATRWKQEVGYSQPTIDKFAFPSMFWMDSYLGNRISVAHTVHRLHLVVSYLFAKFLVGDDFPLLGEAAAAGAESLLVRRFFGSLSGGGGGGGCGFGSLGASAILS